MKELLYHISRNWFPWLHEYLAWWVGLGIVIVFVLFLLHNLRRRSLLDALPATISLAEWKRFRRHHQPRRLCNPKSGKTMSVSTQLAKLRESIRKGELHHLVVLCPPDSGRTWLLLEIFHSLRRGGLRVVFISLQEPEALKSLSRVKSPLRTWVLIDDAEALDPKWHARERLEAILNACEQFKGVVLAAQPKAWPEGWQSPDAQGRIKLVGEEHFYWAWVSQLEDWTEQAARKWLLSKESKMLPAMASRILEGLDWRNPSWRRPAVLEAIAQSDGKEGYSRYLYQVAASAIHQAVKACGDPSWLSRLDHIAHGGVLASKEPIPPPILRIVTPHRDGVIRFRRQLYRAYFVAHRAWSKDHPDSLQELQSQPETKRMYLELAWESFLHTCGPSPGHWLQATAPRKVPLRDLSIPDLEACRYLELTDYQDKDLRFLRLLTGLERIWIPGSGLGHEHIFQHWKPLRGARLWVLEGSKSKIGWEYRSEYGQKKGWEPIESLVCYHPTLAPDPRLKSDGSHPFRQLFRLDPLKLPNPLCSPIPLPDDEHRAFESAYELTMPVGEFNLFDKVFAYQFPGGDVHLQYLHSRSSKHLVTLIQAMLDRWATFYGPDDYGRRNLTDAEIIDIQMGYWPGRQWLSFDAPSYTYPVIIHVPRHSEVELWMRLPKHVSPISSKQLV